jgi:hypothetical protein
MQCKIYFRQSSKLPESESSGCGDCDVGEITAFSIDALDDCDLGEGTGCAFSGPLLNRRRSF